MVVLSPVSDFSARNGAKSYIAYGVPMLCTCALEESWGRLNR